MDRRRIGRSLLVAAPLALGLSVVGKGWPKDQTVHYVLGDAATRVEEVDARWAGDARGDDWTREVSFRYPAGRAPRVVTHEPRLPDGDYTVEIELVAADSEHSVVRRHVVLRGGVTSIDVSTWVPR